MAQKLRNFPSMYFSTDIRFSKMILFVGKANSTMYHDSQTNSTRVRRGQFGVLDPTPHCRPWAPPGAARVVDQILQVLPGQLGRSTKFYRPFLGIADFRRRAAVVVYTQRQYLNFSTPGERLEIWKGDTPVDLQVVGGWCPECLEFDRGLDQGPRQSQYINLSKRKKIMNILDIYT